jgi:hypothetical protein
MKEDAEKSFRKPGLIPTTKKRFRKSGKSLKKSPRTSAQKSKIAC